MRTRIKLVTGLVPVAMGVAIALTPCITKAANKGLWAQPGSASDRTTQPSVGHRPVITSANVFTDSQFKNDINSGSTNVKKGDSLYVKVDTVIDSDMDKLSADYTCDVSRIDNSNSAIPVAVNVPCAKGLTAIPVTIDASFVGQKLAVDIYAHSDISAAQAKGYTPAPTKSLAYRVTSANKVTDSAVIPFLRAAYAEVNGQRVEVNRGEADKPNDDIIYIPSAFTGAKIKIYIEGGNPTYRMNTAGNDGPFVSVVNSTASHSADVTLKDSFVNSPDGSQLFSIIDGGGRPGGGIINFRIKVKELFISRNIEATWNDAKTNCESAGYEFPYFGKDGYGHNGDPGNNAVGSLSNASLFWGEFSGFPNAGEKYWTKTEHDNFNALTIRLSSPVSLPDTTRVESKSNSNYVVCKKVF